MLNIGDKMPHFEVMDQSGNQEPRSADSIS